MKPKVAILAALLWAFASPALGSSLLVVVDAGHGGEKDGAIGPGGLKEKELALAISLKLRDELEALGHRVILTRDSDVPLGLGRRVEIANEGGADLFVSIHANSVARRRDRIEGVETYFLSADASDARARAVAKLENADDDEAPRQNAPTAIDWILEDLARTEAHAESSRLAMLIHQSLVEGTRAVDRGVRQAPFFVLTGARMPAVLVEVGYISHPKESRRLANEKQQGRIAAAIAEGINAFGARNLASASPGEAIDAQERQRAERAPQDRDST